MGDVAELVNHYIVQHSGRSVHEAVVKGQGSGGGTAAPASLLVTDSDAGISSAGLFDEVLYTFGKVVFGSVAVAVVKDLYAF